MILALLVPPVSPVILTIMIWSLMAPVNVYAMQISGVKIPEPPLTIARIVSQAVRLALMVTPVSPVILTMSCWTRLMKKTPVDLYAMIISTVTPHSLTIAWNVSQAVRLAPMVTPVSPVILIMSCWTIDMVKLKTPVDFSAILISTVKRASPTIARIVSQAVRNALMVTPVSAVILTMSCWTRIMN